MNDILVVTDQGDTVAISTMDAAQEFTEITEV